MKYRCVHQHVEEYPIRMMARLLKVSASGYYDWRKRRQSARAQNNQQLTMLMKEIHQESDGTYGSPRMWIELRDDRGQLISENRVARLMRRARIRGSIKKRYRVPISSYWPNMVSEAR